MGLIVRALSLFFTFVNVWDTFKVLKLPPPSPRNGGQPSARAMTQRKRDMKGVMTIWMVWVRLSISLLIMPLDLEP
jgi:receptor expression-enhancing protein 5/6